MAGSLLDFETNTATALQLIIQTGRDFKQSDPPRVDFGPGHRYPRHNTHRWKSHHGPYDIGARLLDSQYQSPDFKPVLSPDPRHLGPARLYPAVPRHRPGGELPVPH